MITPPEIEAYVEAHTTPAPPHLAALAEATRATQESPQMLSGNVEGRFLQMLVWALRPQHVLEIGTYTGSAAQFMAAALPAGGPGLTPGFHPQPGPLARGDLEGRPPRGPLESPPRPGLG